MRSAPPYRLQSLTLLQVLRLVGRSELKLVVHYMVVLLSSLHVVVASGGQLVHSAVAIER